MRPKGIFLSLLLALPWIVSAPLSAEPENPHPGILPPGSRALVPGDAESGAGARASAMGELRFPHDQHSKEFGVECNECHHETNAAPLSYPQHEFLKDFWVDCKTCHRPAGSPKLEPQDCSNCHHSSILDGADETLSAKVVTHKLCWSCHEVGAGEQASASCGDCHSKP